MNGSVVKGHKFVPQPVYDRKALRDEAKGELAEWLEDRIDDEIVRHLAGIDDLTEETA